MDDVPSGLEINRLHKQDGNSRFPQGFPECQGRGPAQVRVEECPRFRQNEISSNERRLPRMLPVEPACFLVVAVGAIGDGVPGSRINEHAHRLRLHLDTDHGGQRRLSGRSTRGR